jgi:cytochrome b pre-mRNA-processing protein 3
MFAWWRSTNSSANVIKSYEIIVSQARQPEFYTGFSVVDNVDGRFDMLGLHMCLVFKRLKSESKKAKEFSQSLFDLMFKDMDYSLREMGVGDLSVGNRVKEMGKALLGRLEAYEVAIGLDGLALENALIRNVYRGNTKFSNEAGELAIYVRNLDAFLAQTTVESIIGGELTFSSAVTYLENCE